VVTQQCSAAVFWGAELATEGLGHFVNCWQAPGKREKRLDFLRLGLYIPLEFMTTQRTLKLLTRVALTLGVLSSLAFAGAIKDNSLSGSSNGSSITIRWISADESGVVRFDIERRTGLTMPFSYLVGLQPKGSNSTYEFVDETAFRTTETLYQYTVKVVYADGSTVDYGPITVSHKTSDVRRTWGSIKAMFR
jgi:hypothetical protein